MKEILVKLKKAKRDAKTDADIPINTMLTRAERQHILSTRDLPLRFINRKERRVILASLEAYKDAGSEGRHMIQASVEDILGL